MVRRGPWSRKTQDTQDAEMGTSRLGSKAMRVFALAMLVSILLLPATARASWQPPKGGAHQSMYGMERPEQRNANPNEDNRQIRRSEPVSQQSDSRVEESQEKDMSEDVTEVPPPSPLPPPLTTKKSDKKAGNKVLIALLAVLAAVLLAAGVVVYRRRSANPYGTPDESTSLNGYTFKSSTMSKAFKKSRTVSAKYDNLQ